MATTEDYLSIYPYPLIPLTIPGAYTLVPPTGAGNESSNPKNGAVWNIVNGNTAFTSVTLGSETVTIDYVGQ